MDKRLDNLNFNNFFFYNKNNEIFLNHLKKNTNNYTTNLPSLNTSDNYINDLSKSCGFFSNKKKKMSFNSCIRRHSSLGKSTNISKSILNNNYYFFKRLYSSDRGERSRRLNSK